MGSVVSIREQVLELHERLERTARCVKPEALHWRPEEQAWSVAQILAHIAEFEHFFSSDVLNLKQHPGARFGRTMEHPERLQAVELTGDETLDTLLDGVHRGKHEVLAMLDALTDEDLAIEGTHPKFGTRTIEWEIGHFITEHIEKHIGQVERTYAAYCKTAERA
ncbi:MAG: DinB family protein [Alicyclobacillus macrosporangiidus]|uniref:DinB family protein n=1 Tax=Alicyclobacillus macrosporangiidus TaxID=392015 RepID=UPI0026F1DAF4|nr:DinB family protein [Alicyclobacillus macrosporangiidus]MCL6600937.1 DinB family protein [Alicyclobacillus macrosporangiidus]